MPIIDDFNKYDAVYLNGNHSFKKKKKKNSITIKGHNQY